MIYVRVPINTCVYPTRFVEKLTGRTKERRLAGFHPDVVCPEGFTPDEGYGDIQIMEGRFKGKWAYLHLSMCEVVSPLELLAREAE